MCEINLQKLVGGQDARFQEKLPCGVCRTYALVCSTYTLVCGCRGGWCAVRVQGAGKKRPVVCVSVRNGCGTRMEGAQTKGVVSSTGNGSVMRVG